MSDWPVVELGSICEFKYGRSLPAGKRVDGDFPVYGSNGVVGSHTKALTAGPTIVIGRKGSFGEVHFARGACWPIDTTYFVDSSCTDVDLGWLAQMLPTLRLTELNRAAAVPGLNREDAYRRTLRLPPLLEQRRIAAILDQADALRAKRRQTLVHLDDLTQSIFLDMFGGEPFTLVTAGELMPTMRNGLSPATAGEHPAEVLTLSAVTRGAFDPTSVKPGRFAVNPPPDKRVSALDFMMCRGNGNKALVGVGAFSREDRPDLVFPDTVIAGRVDVSTVTMPFLDAAWKQQEVRRQIEAVARTTNGTFKVNQQTLSSVSVPLPPFRLQQEFGARVERVNARRAAGQRAAAAGDELFAALQSRAFRGEL